MKKPATMEQIPVIDLFAGPGGLGEGFSSLESDNRAAFRIALSIEKDATAHQTLLLRSFYRQFRGSEVPIEYYRRLRGEIPTNEELFLCRPQEAARAKQEAWCAELGSPQPGAAEVDRRIVEALRGSKSWVLIGGPPCQAYSVVGRSRRASEDRAKFERDPRHFLYREYLRILREHKPAVFVMENVKGILSAKIQGKAIFDRILADLSEGYHLHGLATPGSASLFHETPPDPSDFVLKSERFGIPQARHRVIIVGVRKEIQDSPVPLHQARLPVSVMEVIGDLPPLRSRVSRGPDVVEEWVAAIRESLDSVSPQSELGRQMRTAVERLRTNADLGGTFVPGNTKPEALKSWFFDRRLGGACNHESRSHREDDLARYFFAACFSKTKGRSPTLAEFPAALLPEHQNVIKADGDDYAFADRFRVQVGSRPATTVTSHIAKDGHYFIHPDPTQCRSLTVREAARLQSFPDNYFFCGNRTSQFQQVGNAVPPLLATKIARETLNLLQRSSLEGESKLGLAEQRAS